jgi:serine protease Do
MWSATARPDTPDPCPSAAPVISANLSQNIQSVVVKVWVDDYWASGILIGRSGDRYAVLTNKHVLNNGEQYQIQTSDGRKRGAALLSVVQFGDQDLGILTFNDPNHHYPLVAIGDLSLPEVGTPVAAAGFPFNYKLDLSSEVPPTIGPNGKTLILPGNLWLTNGQISRVVDRQFRQGYQVGYTNLVLKGMSGGPLVDEQGCLVGINGRHAYPIWGNPYVFKDGSRPADEEAATLIRSSWAIPISTVLPALQSIAGWQWGSHCLSTRFMVSAAHPGQVAAVTGLQLLGSGIARSPIDLSRGSLSILPATPLAAITRVQIGPTLALGVILTREIQGDRRYQYRVLLSGNRWAVGSPANLVTAEGQTYPAQVGQIWSEDQFTLVEFHSHRPYNTVQIGRLSSGVGAPVTVIGLQAWPGSEQFAKTPLATTVLPVSYPATLTLGSLGDSANPTAQLCSLPVPGLAKGAWPLFDRYQRLTGWLQPPPTIPEIASSSSAPSPSVEPDSRSSSLTPTTSPPLTPLSLNNIKAPVIALPPQIWQLLDQQSAATVDRSQS